MGSQMFTSPSIENAYVLLLTDVVFISWGFYDNKNNDLSNLFGYQKASFFFPNILHH